MKVYIVHRDVEYEFGHVVEVYGNLADADRHMRDLEKASRDSSYSVETWEV